jgi:sucrose-6-phosphate hydrolase SacC (GH32 family)
MHPLILVMFIATWPAYADERILLADFEGESFAPWTVEGDAFGTRPAMGTLPGQQPVSGFAGKGFANSFHQGDASTGSLRSPEFTVERPYMNLLVGGGQHPGRAAVQLILDNKVVREATGSASTGSDDEHLSWRTWDVRDLAGSRVHIRIIDNAVGGWGHINVDELELSSTPRAVQGVDESLTLSMASVAGASARAQADPLRPQFHLMPPALWCNDPNGPIFHQGWYHLFYQHNPLGDRWEHMHWGHARSRDLIHWEQLPIALRPSVERGETHVFSGSAARNALGEVMLFYTSIGERAPEQWAAVAADDEMRTFRKLDANPILHEKAHGSVKIDDWRDPFVFEHAGDHWMVCGGHQKGRKGSIQLYQADDATLTRWSYRGIPLVGTEDNWECPNLFALDGRWLLTYSPHGPVRYHVGDLDVRTPRFTSTSTGFIDHSGDFYATTAAPDGQGKWILWGWIRGFPAGRGWNGCISLPRAVRIDPDGKLHQSPAPPCILLRDQHLVHQTNLELNNDAQVLSVRGRELEIDVEFDADEARVGFKILRSSDGQRGSTVSVEGDTLEVAGHRARTAASYNEKARRRHLHIFVDRSLAEVFLDDCHVVTKVLQADPADESVELFVEKGSARIHRLDVWNLTSSTPR